MITSTFQLKSLQVPAFLPAECFLVYLGSTNAFQNNLRTRSLLSFISVVLQIPAGLGLQLILDHEKCQSNAVLPCISPAMLIMNFPGIGKRKTRVFIGLVVVGIPLTAAWIWEIFRVRNYNRNGTITTGVDWTEKDFVPTFFLFTLNWVASSLWQYLIL